ncbi:MAG TPA: hypothetical protein PKC96_07515 [Bacilli bacterium]|nr:hypothetical protein [Bacilli bacterium]
MKAKKQLTFAFISTILCGSILIASKIGDVSRIFPANAEASSSAFMTFNFLDGGDSANQPYANTDLSTNVTTTGYSSTKSPWEADYANLSLKDGTRLGGKLASAVQTDDTTAWANIKTKFTFERPIDALTLSGAATFGTADNVEHFYVQYSSSGTVWTTVVDIDAGLESTAKILVVNTQGLIPENSYLRFGIGLKSSGTNSGLAFTGLTVHDYALCSE